MNSYPTVVKTIMDAIASVESRGVKDPYSAVGKKTKSGDRAYGKYQVMGLNIPSWTKEALGKEMTPKEFLNNPNAQDAVAAKRMGALYEKHGNVGDVASVWFTGRPIAKAGNVKDVTGTTNQQYVAAVVAAMPSSKPPASPITKPANFFINAYNNLFGVNPNLHYVRPTTTTQPPTPQPTVAPQPPVAPQPLARQWTQNGRITVPFGGRTAQESFHPGVDIAAPKGTPVPSPIRGIVTSTDYGHIKGENNYGNSVIVRDANGDNHRFSHLNNGYVKVGQPVNKGQTIATIGDTGATYSPSGGPSDNLDYRISTKYGQMKNPMLYLKNTA